jgi:hypothetical protein
MTSATPDQERMCMPDTLIIADAASLMRHGAAMPSF